MIHLEINDADRILVVEMKGMISEADIDGAIDALQARYPAVGVHLRGGERGGFSMLADWQDLEGWEMGAKTLGTVTTKTLGDAVRKIAILAGAQFVDEQPRLVDIAKRAEVRFFPPGQREDAMAWLRSR
jgi:stage II sporulation SpoAA-like protein